MAINRELKWVSITLGPNGDSDVVRVNVRLSDDTDAEIEVFKDKDINVGAQVKAAIQPLVDVLLGKLSDVNKPVTRPLA